MSLLALGVGPGLSAAAADAGAGQAERAPALAQAAETFAFNIAAQPASSALLAFGQQSGYQVSVDHATLAGLESPGVTGRLPAEEALRRLLAGTGVTWSFTDEQSVTLTRVSGDAAAITLDTITVQDSAETATGPVPGYVARRSATATKTDTPILETPQALSVVTAQQISDQGAQTVSQALRYTPGIFVEPNGASSRYDETRVRGFMPVQYLDGLQVPLNQFFATPRIEPYGLERVEVLKGPSSALYGENGPGGLLNMVTKRPTLEPLHEIQITGGSNALKQGAFDLGGPLDEDGRFLFRLTGLARDADTEVDYTEDDRLFLAPALTWQPNEDTSITFLASLGTDDGSYPQQYVPAEGTLLDNPNGKIPRSRFAGEPDFDRFNRSQYSFGYSAEHRVTDGWELRQNLRYGAVDTYFEAFRSEGLQPDLRTLNRSAFSQAVEVSTLTLDNQSIFQFGTGPVEHDLLVGVDYLYSEGSYDFRYAFGGSPSLDIFDPVYGSPIPALDPLQDNYQTRSQLGFYAQDQLRFDNWLLTLSGRSDWADSRTENRFDDSEVESSDHAFTGRVGLGYLFNFGLAPYVSYATSFQPTPGTDITGSPFEPTTGRQVEAGIKYQPPGSDSLFTVSVFDLKQENALTPDPVDPVNFQTQTGEIRVRGFELEGKASLMEGLDFTAAYTFLDSEVTESNNTDEEGRPVPMTPKHQASAWLQYGFQSGPLKGLSLGSGIRYVGPTYSETSSPDPLEVPGYTLVDAAVHYELGALDPSLEGARLSVNATNLFDRYYVTYCYGTAYCSLGAGRTVLATLSYSW